MNVPTPFATRLRSSLFARRAVLSTIKPGSFPQLVAGLMMNILFVILLCLACPYNDNRDNSIAVLSTLQIIVIFIASMLMRASKLFSEDGYDAEVMGVLLIVSQAIIIVLFLAWAFYQKDKHEHKL